MRGCWRGTVSRRIRASEQDIARALTGNWREEHLFVLKQALGMYEDIAQHLRECDLKLQALLVQCLTNSYAQICSIRFRAATILRRMSSPLAFQT